MSHQRLCLFVLFCLSAGFICPPSRAAALESGELAASNNLNDDDNVEASVILSEPQHDAGERKLQKRGIYGYGYGYGLGHHHHGHHGHLHHGFGPYGLFDDYFGHHHGHHGHHHHLHHDHHDHHHHGFYPYYGGFLGLH